MKNKWTSRGHGERGEGTAAEGEATLVTGALSLKFSKDELMKTGPITQQRISCEFNWPPKLWVPLLERTTSCNKLKGHKLIFPNTLKMLFTRLTKHNYVIQHWLQTVLSVSSFHNISETRTSLGKKKHTLQWIDVCQRKNVSGVFINNDKTCSLLTEHITPISKNHLLCIFSIFFKEQLNSLWQLMFSITKWHDNY